MVNSLKSLNIALKPIVYQVKKSSDPMPFFDFEEQAIATA
jgi:hypothetical protein